MAFQLLKELGHQHRILASRDADRDPVSFLNKLVLYDGLFETTDQVMTEGLAKSLVNVISVCLEIQVSIVDINISIVSSHRNNLLFIKGLL